MKYQLTARSMKLFIGSMILIGFVISSSIVATIAAFFLTNDKSNNETPLPNDIEPKITMANTINETKENEYITLNELPLAQSFINQINEEFDLIPEIEPEPENIEREENIPVDISNIEDYQEEVYDLADNIIEYEENEYIEDHHREMTIEELLANFQVTPWSEIRHIIPPTNTWHEYYEDINEDSKFYMYDVLTGRILKFYNGSIGNAHMDIAPTTEEQANKFHEMVAGDYSWNSRIVIIIHNNVAHLASIHTNIHGGGPSFFTAGRGGRYRGGGFTRTGGRGHICIHFPGSRNSQRQHQRGINYFLQNMPEEGFTFVINNQPFQFQLERDILDDLVDYLLLDEVDEIDELVEFEEVEEIDSPQLRLTY